MNPVNKLTCLQRTIAHPVTLKGVGLHSGDDAEIRLCPAPVDHGVVFHRVDCEGDVRIPARLSYVGDTRLCTTLEHKGHHVATVEHLLSAIVGLQIDNILVEINGPEVPIMDGSAAPFVLMLQSSGVRSLSSLRKVVRVLEPIVVQHGDKVCKLLPYDGFKLSMEVDFEHPVFDESNRFKTIDMSYDSYPQTVSRARTFGFVEDVERLQKSNLAKGASLQNAVGFDRDSVVNPEGLRYYDEPVVHKILDAIGDLSLLGHYISAEFEGRCSGHTMNKLLLDKLVTSPCSWTLLS